MTSIKHQILDMTSQSLDLKIAYDAIHYYSLSALHVMSDLVMIKHAEISFLTL